VLDGAGFPQLALLSHTTLDTKLTYTAMPTVDLVTEYRGHSFVDIECFFDQQLNALIAAAPGVDSSPGRLSSQPVRVFWPRLRERSPWKVQYSLEISATREGFFPA
jgi:hypothetical protein